MAIPAINIPLEQVLPLLALPNLVMLYLPHVTSESLSIFILLRTVPTSEGSIDTNKLGEVCVVFGRHGTYPGCHKTRLFEGFNILVSEPWTLTVESPKATEPRQKVLMACTSQRVVISASPP